jgi:O-antigen/teichoic acid export membrane protein
MISKVSGAIAQLTMLPLALVALGEVRFAAFLTLTALAAWMSPIGLGLLPALTREIAASSTKPDLARQRTMFAAAFWFTSAVSVTILLAVIVIAGIWDPRPALGLDLQISASEVSLGLVAAVGVVAVHFLATLSQAMRAGFQESHISNILMAIANLVCFLAVWSLSRGEPGIAAIILAAYAPITLMCLIDIGIIIRQRPYLWPPHIGENAGSALKTLLGTSMVAWVGQVHYFLTAFATVVMVSRYFDTASTTAFGAMMRASILGYGVVALFIWPMVPALTDAVHRGDSRWVRVSCRRIATFTFVASLSGGLVIALASPDAMRFWMGDSVVVPQAMAIGFGLYFFAWNCNFAGFNMQLAIGHSSHMAYSFLLELLIVFGLALILSPRFGASGVALALGIGAMAINFWWLPLRIVRQVKKMPVMPDGTQ